MSEPGTPEPKRLKLFDELYRELARMRSIERLWENAIDCVDDVFQESGHDCSLPDFAQAGDCKFEAVKKLAVDYNRLQGELIELARYAAHVHQVARQRGVRLPSWDDWCRNKEQSR